MHTYDTIWYVDRYGPRIPNVLTFWGLTSRDLLPARAVNRKWLMVLKVQFFTEKSIGFVFFFLQIPRKYSVSVFNQEKPKTSDGVSGFCFWGQHLPVTRMKSRVERQISNVDHQPSSMLGVVVRFGHRSKYVRSHVKRGKACAVTGVGPSVPH